MNRFGSSVLLRVVPPVLSLLCAALLGTAIVAAIGLNPFDVLRNLAATANRPPWGLRDDFAYVLLYATPLVFFGLAVAVAFRAGLFNIGGLGQILIASILCGYAGWKSHSLPSVVAVPFCIAAAAFGGAAWAAIAGALKAWRGSHEVIITIMLNFCAVAVTDALANGPWKSGDGMTAQLPPVAPQARLPRLGVRPAGADASVPPGLGIPAVPWHVQLNASIFIALLTAAGVWVFLFRTTAGYELRAVGLNPEAARAAGIPVNRVILKAMAISGAIAGLAATDLVMGWKGTYGQDDANSYGRQAFIGIAVSLMGQNHPAGILLAALLFGALQHFGGLLKGVPTDLVFILQAAVILFVICGHEIFRRLLAGRAVAA